MKRQRFHRAIFIAAGIYNICWGLFTAYDPGWLFRFAGMEPANYPEIFSCLGMVVGVYGLIYFEVARRPDRGFLLAGVGFLGKVLGPIGMLVLVGQGKWKPGALIMNVTNDFIWLVPFALYLYDSWGYYRKDLIEKPD